MADMSNFMGVFRAQGPEDKRKVTKRNRQAVSCVPCRQKKLKCDRQQPCSSCTKRGSSLSCEFGIASVVPPVRSREKTRAEAQARLQKLEEMVNSLIQTRKSGETSTGMVNGEMQERMENLDVSEQADRLRDSTGYFLSRKDTEASFVGATHWIAILEGIHDLKDYLDADAVSQTHDSHVPLMMSLGAESIESTPSNVSSIGTSQSEATKNDLILGPYEPLSIEAALEALPERTICDNLLALYFTNKFFAVPFLHSRKFQREYVSFRENPKGTSFMFISVLFSVLCISSGILSASGKATAWPSEAVNPRKYMQKAAQAIVTGEYLKAQPYVIEALLLHCHSKFLRTVDSEPSLWALAGLVVRLAQKLGMHRDPARLSTPISPFAAEMRRRMWFHCETFDLLMSFQLGMPPMINENECDIGNPRNLLASDFDEDTTELPPERPDTDDSSLLFFVYKSKVIRLFRRVIRHALSTHQPPYSETMAIDRELRQLHDKMPARLRIVPIAESPFSDTTGEIMKRLMLEMLHQKSLAVLHRTFLTFEKDNPMYAESRDTAVNASIRVLDLQEEYTRETSPGGRIYEERWMMSSLTLHDFLMSAMIVCLDLAELPQKSPEVREQKINRLKTAYHIWNEKRDISRDACHAANVIAAMLSKVAGQDPMTGKPFVQVVDRRAEGPARHAAELSNSASQPSVSGGRMPGEPCMIASVYDSLHGSSLADIENTSGIGSGQKHQGSQASASQVTPQSHPISGSSPSTDDSFELMDLDSLDEMLSNTENLDWTDRASELTSDMQNLIDQYLRDFRQEQPGHVTLDPLSNVL